MNQLRGGWSMIEAGLNLKQGGFSKYPYLSYKTIYRFRTPRSRSSSISRNEISAVGLGDNDSEISNNRTGLWEKGGPLKKINKKKGKKEKGTLVDASCIN
ncbi:hypothetical protein AFLA_004064 [Aspergillus flavus NRRL3357]|nr:hypothetical protein AFLA_004064 [Aspergillus flavus NRRL3357]